MRASRFLIVAGCLAVLGGGLYATAVQVTSFPTTGQVHENSWSGDQGDGYARDISVLRGEMALLRAEIDELKGIASGASVLRAELAALGGEVGALRGQLGQAAQRGVNLAGPTGEGDAMDLPPLSGEDMEFIAEEQAYEDDRRRQLLNSVFQAEPFDSEWSAETTDRIMDAFDHEELARSDVTAAECRASLCRIEVNQSDSEAAGNFGLWFPMQVAEVLPQIAYFHEPHGDGGAVTVMYLARSGYSLPLGNP